MNSNFEITVAKPDEKTKSIDEKSMSNLSFNTFKFNSEKSTNSELIFTSTSKLIDYYIYGVIYIVVAILIFNFLDKFEFHGKFSSIFAQGLMLSALVTFVGLIIIPFTMMKNVIFISSDNKLYVQEQSPLGTKKEILDFDKVKKVITKVDSKNSYITFRSGNVLPQSIIIKVETENILLIKETNDFLQKFTENKYPNIEYSQI
jgi:hypothetical protein